jgi:hypothetical protein
MFVAISTITAATALSMREVGKAIKDIAKAMDEVPSEKAIQFRTVIDSVRRLSEQGSKNIETRETIRNTTSNLVSNIVGNNVKNSLISSGANQGTNGKNLNGERTIILQLGDRVLKKFVLDVLNDELSVRKIR